MNLTEIKARESKATKGKWWWITESGITRLVSRRCNPWSTVIDGDMWASEDDKTFIAHSIEDIPDLIAECERLTKRLERAEEVLRMIHSERHNWNPDEWISADDAVNKYFSAKEP